MLRERRLRDIYIYTQMYTVHLQLKVHEKNTHFFLIFQNELGLRGVAPVRPRPPLVMALSGSSA